ncbi:MAG: SDR family oxidoreductase [Gammaproteobacteria bacterium]|nr:SDR family oxidoreductase [Gammaproteobacteria bacterium]
MMADLWSLTGKRALIVGATRGIGAAIAETLMQLGAEVTIISRNKEDLEKCTQAWRNAGHVCHYICSDLSNPKAPDDIFKSFNEIYSDAKLDILINNIGIVLSKPTQTITADDYEFVMQMNLTSVFKLCQNGLPYLKRSTNPCIVNITSINTFKATPENVLAGMTRTAINHLTKSLAVEWSPYKIRVNAVAPGFTNTDRMKSYSQEQLSNIVQKIPLQRIAEPQEIAAAAVFLCLPAASYITGQCIIADGGSTL